MQQQLPMPRWNCEKEMPEGERQQGQELLQVQDCML